MKVPPTFICIGSQKAGTRSLYDMMRGHEEVWMPPIKELHFFDAPFQRERTQRRQQMLQTKKINGEDLSDCDLHFIRQLDELVSAGTCNLESYISLFKIAEGMVTGDITPAYATIPASQVKNIAAALPDTRILLVLREPVSRLWSHARMHARNKGQPIDSDLTEFRDFCGRPLVRSRSFQSQVYEVWKKFFDKRLHVLFFDDLRDNSELFYGSVCRILGIDENPAKTTHPLSHNRKGHHQSKPIPRAMAQVASEMLAEEYERLAMLVGGHAQKWLDDFHGKWL